MGQPTNIHQLASARAEAQGGSSPPARPANIETRTHRVNLNDSFAESLQREPYQAKLVERIADWLAATFADHPFRYAVGLVFPLTVAAFCVGYFGLRQILAGFGL